MAKIALLSEDIINKIAAGEVIERPASVVKELVENALDAKATSITIDIEDSGKRLIRVLDTGDGMERDDAERALLRHATSKIRNGEDLFAITTLGFRGEALASIAAVSQLTLVTKKRDSIEGFKLEAKGGTVQNSSITAAEAGTMLEVRNLFFNTPARKKFLKTDAVELRHILDVVTHYALANPGVSFRLKHEGHDLLHSPAVHNQQDAIASLYGLQLAKNLLELSYQENGLSITGFVASPLYARNDKTQQHVYVNGRWVRSEEISQAVYDAFHSMLFVHKHPVMVLNITIDPHKIDVNVHPAKTQVKFEQKDLVYNAVLSAVRETIRKHNLIPAVDVEMEEQLTFEGIKLVEKPVVSTVPVVKESKYAFEPSRQTVFYVNEKAADGEMSAVTPTPMASSLRGRDHEEDLLGAAETIFTSSAIPTAEDSRTLPASGRFPELKLLGQVHKTFFVAETPGGLFFIDQHAAHERVLYEEFMAQFQEKQIDVQYLLQGEVVEVTAAEKIAIESQQQFLTRLGFTLEPFGERAFKLVTIPTVLGRIQHKTLLYEIIGQVQEGKNKVEELKEEILTRMACRAAIMAGDEITLLEMDSILRDLAGKKDPYTCPHGRPVMLKTTAEELEKKFKRKG